jgi:phosphoglycolate phosphatase
MISSTHETKKPNRIHLGRYRHILWDWNGTLFDDVGLCVGIINSLLAKRGLPLITLEGYRAGFRFPVRDYYRDLGFDFNQDSYENLSVEFMAQYEKRRFECPLQPHAHEALSHVQSLGLKQSILSAYAQDSLRELVRYFKLTSFSKKFWDWTISWRMENWRSGDSGYKPTDIAPLKSF